MQTHLGPGVCWTAIPAVSLGRLTIPSLSFFIYQMGQTGQ